MKNLWIAIIGLCIAGCGSADEPTLELKPTEINFSSIAVGQKTYYLKFTSNCLDYVDEFELTGDTLVVEVIQENDSLFFQESLTEMSPTYVENPVNEVLNQFVDVQAEQLIIPNRQNSRLFFFYGNDTLRLNSDYTAVLNQSSCRMMINNQSFVGEEIGLIPSFRIGAFRLKNKTAVSCVPVWMLMEAYLVYDRNQLYASQTIVNDLVSGWVKR